MDAEGLQEIVKTEELVKNLYYFFPDEGYWCTSCLDKKKNKKLDMQYLPCNLHDYKWLAAMFKKQRNIDMDEEKIYDFLLNSFEFNNLKDKYEEKVVTFQIEHLLSLVEDLDAVSYHKYKKSSLLRDKIPYIDYYYDSPNADVLFRLTVVNILKAINISEHIIEKGLEENSDLWLIQTMERTFENSYNYEQLEDFYCDNREIHKKAWVNYRMYEYNNLRHKKSVDKYRNEVTIEEKDAKALYYYLNKMDEKINKYLTEKEHVRVKK